MFTDIVEINRHILYFIPIEDIINLLDINSKTRNIVIKILPCLIDKNSTLFSSGSTKVELDNLIDRQFTVPLIIKLMIYNEIDISTMLMKRIYQQNKYTFTILTRAIFNEDNLSLLKIFFAANPSDFNWQDNYIETEHSYKLSYEKVMAAIIETKSIAAMKYFLPYAQMANRFNHQESLTKLIEICIVMLTAYELQKLLTGIKTRYPDIDIDNMIK